MKENFDKALQQVLLEEGGYVDDPRDSGGATMKGITIEVYRQYKNNPYITKEQLRNISNEDVASLYRSRYWSIAHCDDLPAGIDFLVFDFGVNAGMGMSAKILQKCLFVAQDGVIGLKTLDAAKNANIQNLIELFTTNRVEYYRGLKQFPIYGQGWLIRTERAKNFALSLLN